MNLFKCVCQGKKKKTVDQKIEEINENIITYQKKKQHLICDDAMTNRLVLIKYITLYGFQCEEAENGKQAIDLVENNKIIYDIIWMDIKMPKMNGIEATEYLRKKLHYEGIIIGLTGYVDELTVNKCYSVGMDHVLSKPFDKNIIKMYVDKYSQTK